MLLPELALLTPFVGVVVFIGWAVAEQKNQVMMGGHSIGWAVAERRNSVMMGGRFIGWAVAKRKNPVTMGGWAVVSSDGRSQNGRTR